MPKRIRAENILDEVRDNWEALAHISKPIHDVRDDDIIEVHVRKVAAQDFYTSMIKSKISFGDIKITAHIAETQAQKIAGLEASVGLDEDEGLLFPFDPPEHATFHMGAVKFPIDIIFLMKDAEGLRIAKIAHNIQPGAKDRWSHPDTVAVLEVNGGTCKQMGLKVGSVCKAKMSVSLNSGIELE